VLAPGMSVLVDDVQGAEDSGVEGSGCKQDRKMLNVLDRCGGVWPGGLWWGKNFWLDLRLTGPRAAPMVRSQSNPV